MILVTGANGRLGRAIALRLVEDGQPVRAAARAVPEGLVDGIAQCAVGPLGPETDWTAAVSGVKAVIHCAALTWIDPESGDPAEFHRVNVAATEALARAARTAGATTFVYISSLTVNGKHSGARPFRHDDPPNPQSPYSQSKWDAEVRLRAVEAETGLAVVVIRPPRIIWPELSGNLAVLEKLIRRGIPLPFGMLNRNARDNVSAARLVEVAVRSAVTNDMRGKTFLVSDNNPMSTRALVQWIGRRIGRRPLLLPVPEVLLRAIVRTVPQRMTGKLNREELLGELTLSLRIDPTELVRSSADRVNPNGG